MPKTVVTVGSWPVKPGFVSVGSEALKKVLNVVMVERMLKKTARHPKSLEVAEMHKKLSQFCAACSDADEEKVNVLVLACLLDKYGEPLVCQYVCRCGEKEESFILAAKFFEDVPAIAMAKKTILPALGRQGIQPGA